MVDAEAVTGCSKAKIDITLNAKYICTTILAICGTMSAALPIFLLFHFVQRFVFAQKATTSFGAPGNARVLELKSFISSLAKAARYSIDVTLVEEQLANISLLLIM